MPRYEDGDLAEGQDFSRASSWKVQDSYHWSFDEADYVKQVINEHGREVVAAAAQSLLEEQVLEIVGPLMEQTGVDNLATAGGVFLNVQLNARILEEIGPEDYFIFPNAGDGGLPTGAALAAHRFNHESFRPFRLNHSYFGHDITHDVPERFDERQINYEAQDDIVATCAELLADGKIVAWCQGRMEYGPRALGNRSILIDPTKDDSMDRVNQRVKFRDSWRPFAPSILEDAIDEYFVNPTYDPFMITSYDVREEKQDEIPAVTHVDGTARPQVVRRNINERYWRLIKTFGERTGTPVLLNTSFNLSGDPIVRDARDAIGTFYNCGLDALALGDYLITKSGPNVTSQ
jgi:carbamoyltransferase